MVMTVLLLFLAMKQCGASKMDKVNFNLPFGELLAMGSIPVGGKWGGGGREVNFPFSDVGLPPFLKKVLKPPSLKASDRPFLQTIGGRIQEGQKTSGNREIGVAPPYGGKPAAPLSVMNMPFAKFNMPLANIQEEHHKLPPQVEAQKKMMKSLGAKGSNGKQRTPFFVGDPAKGNLDTMLLTGTGKASPLVPVSNKLSLPLSIMHMPHNLVELPLSKLMMPFSNINNIPLPAGSPTGGASFLDPFGPGMLSPLDSLLGLGPLARDSEAHAPAAASAAHLAPAAHGSNAALTHAAAASHGTAGVGHTDGAHSPTEGGGHGGEGGDHGGGHGEGHGNHGSELTPLVEELAAAMVPPGAINLNAFSLPYSFLNSPLGWMNSPITYLNLPYASSNMPFAHLNLPFGFNNYPFTEMLQTFGGMGGHHARAADEPTPPPTPQQQKASPLDDPTKFVSTTDQDLQQLTKTELKTQKEALYFAEALKRLSTFNATGGIKMDGKASKPRDAMRLTDNLITTFAAREEHKGEMSIEEAKTSLEKFHRALRDYAPVIPDMGGLFGTPLALFTTPFSLFNLPFGFNDMPLGFTNLPLSHFNLPLSHLSLPFASLALPIDEMATPDFEQDVHYTSTELADIPPSLLQVLNPDNTMSSYLNMPLAEMNMPLAVMEMPFAVFDMPFAFMNLPMGHFNNPFTHLHLPFEIATLPLAELTLPFEAFINYPQPY